MPPKYNKQPKIQCTDFDLTDKYPNPMRCNPNTISPIDQNFSNSCRYENVSETLCSVADKIGI